MTSHQELRILPRQRLTPGHNGKITVKREGGRYAASVYVRDSDGRRRRVERSSPRSAEDARRELPRHLRNRRAPLTGQTVTERTTLAELFEMFVDAQIKEDGIQPQTADHYRRVWRCHGAGPLGALRIGEFPTSRANDYLQSIPAKSMAKQLRVILKGMYGLAARHDVIATNPLRETRPVTTKSSEPRALTPEEFGRVRIWVQTYTLGLDENGRRKPGPRPGKLLPALVASLAASGGRGNEVLAVRRFEVDVVGDPPTMILSGTMIDHNRIEGKPLHRQNTRKGGAPPHTVVLPEFGAKAIADLLACGSDPMAPLFANRDGGWMSLTNVRSQLRKALPPDLQWVTPHSFRRTVATIVHESLGPAAAQRQLDHRQLVTTETHYIMKSSIGPDAREGLDQFAADADGYVDESGERM